MVRAAESVIVEKCARILGKAGRVSVIVSSFIITHCLMCLVGLRPRVLKWMALFSGPINYRKIHHRPKYVVFVLYKIGLRSIQKRLIRTHDLLVKNICHNKLSYDLIDKKGVHNLDLIVIIYIPWPWL